MYKEDVLFHAYYMTGRRSLVLRSLFFLLSHLMAEVISSTSGTSGVLAVRIA